MNQVKLNSKNFFVKYTQLFSIFFCFCLISLSAQIKNIKSYEVEDCHSGEICTAANQPEQYIHLLKNKKIGLVTNQTGIVQVKSDNSSNRTIPLANYLISKGIIISKIFSPEHGFSGKANAGEAVTNEKDITTYVNIVSLYGKSKKPTPEQLKGIDILVFDMQDVGVRFYTYISTLHYVMEAAAENNIRVIVLDRPNPNAHYIDGPVLKDGFQSFVGMHKVPIVYGMTIGEYARMINGEEWLKNKINCNLTVIPLKNYTHSKKYSLPIPPSPNLLNERAINLYPSTCFFEGTTVSEGRGTDFPFEVYGSPYLKNYSFSFTPLANSGAKNPRYMNQICWGEDLRNEPYLSEIKLKWLLLAYKNNSSDKFFTQQLFFDKLAGTDLLRKQIIAGKSESEIKQSWKNDLENFKKIRIQYLLYPE